MTISVEKTLLSRLVELAYIGLASSPAAADAREIRQQLLSLESQIGDEYNPVDEQNNPLVAEFLAAGLTPLAERRRGTKYVMRRGDIRVVLVRQDVGPMKDVQADSPLVLCYIDEKASTVDDALDFVFATWSGGIAEKVRLFGNGSWAAKRKGYLDLELLKREFQRFPPLESELVSLLEKFGFLNDVSYRNDVCPSIAHVEKNWVLWIDHPEQNEREFDDVRRFSLVETNDEGLPKDKSAFSVETVAELAVELEKWQVSQGLVKGG